MSYTLLGARIPATPLPTAPVPAANFPTSSEETKRRWGFKALSSTQRQTIGRKASDAYQAEIAAGRLIKPAKGVDAAAREWRHAQYQIVTGRTELEQCNQSHYRALRSHFDAMLGTANASARSFRDNMRTGPVNPRKSITDTHEARELWRNNLNETLAKYGYKIGYAIYLAKAKYKTSLGQCNPDQLYGLVCAVHGNARKTGRQPVASGSPAPAPAADRPRLKIIKPAPAPAADDDDDNAPF